ncbi:MULTISPECIES: glycosyltransferase family A protein [Rhizobium]|uniref:glycosyltransferase family A protein n=1 Tax=Rhizobium TaxID=379 RepID=UPI001B32557D|nr:MULTISPECIES: glycosyltransferase family A protein [Rhizobium]MBX4908530.1 glycosyltransferase family 2 protein [Rhizobium bangladeshense]MBX5215882.1 glycosyltransferase family 2 protein [Rhizobium sp. NLR9a]MBX5233747.1 glycosyltransferase family 2 protein [Rhizobium sp. NLR4a]MBX5246580.1 glycosyltransferase family 2 protein [Rhizobium sp. NLR3b]MBX5250765.1 glycosyltransferase family 2 protein [Rhizobium sp. NLR4b]
MNQQDTFPHSSAGTDPSGAPPLNIAVGVLTYRRLDGIAKLLNVMTRQTRHPARPYHLTMVIVDNDAAGSARATVEAFGQTGAYDLIYVVEPNQGIPFARNRALDSAPAGTDLFCFLDDDEWPVDGWLDAMLETRENNRADCVYGPVQPVYPENPPEYFIKARVFERKKNKDGQRISYAASNNVMFDYRLIRSWNLRFEEKMRFTGGTDYLFFNQAIRRGMQVFWADKALVYDIVPASRMTWKWVLQRQYRLGNTFAVSEVLHGNLKRRLYRAAYGATRVMLGLVMLPAILVSPYWGMRALTHVLRGAGMVNGILGHAYQEYRPNAAF